MASVSIPYNFVNGTTANAEEVDANFNSLKSFAETALVQVDGSVKAGLSALAAEVIAQLVPTGTITAFAGVAAPSGWLLCDGTTSTAGYPGLAALVGATTPDLRGHVLVGKSASAPFNGTLLSKFGSTTSTAVHTHGDGTLTASSAGSHDHTYSGTTNAESQDHSHAQLVGLINYETGPYQAVVTTPVGSASGTDANYSTAGKSTTHNHSYSGTVVSNGSHTHDVSGNTGASSTETAHGNVQPSALVNFIIKT